MKMRAEHIIDFVVADAEREQLVAPALLAGKIERRRMALSSPVQVSTRIVWCGVRTTKVW
jgi:hypothetical protein